MSTWEQELTRLERDVHAARSMLDAGEAPPAERWSPPDDLGAMPEPLVARAQALAAELEEARGRASTRRNELGDELARLHKRRDAARAYQTGFGTSDVTPSNTNDPTTP